METLATNLLICVRSKWLSGLGTGLQFNRSIPGYAWQVTTYSSSGVYVGMYELILPMQREQVPHPLIFKPRTTLRRLGSTNTGKTPLVPVLQSTGYEWISSKQGSNRWFGSYGDVSWCSRGPLSNMAGFCIYYTVTLHNWGQPHWDYGTVWTVCNHYPTYSTLSVAACLASGRLCLFT